MAFWWFPYLFKISLGTKNRVLGLQIILIGSCYFVFRTHAVLNQTFLRHDVLQANYVVSIKIMATKMWNIPEMLLWLNRPVWSNEYRTSIQFSTLFLPIFSSCPIIRFLCNGLIDVDVIRIYKREMYEK
jgi:hypothetical protein